MGDTQKGGEGALWMLGEGKKNSKFLSTFFPARISSLVNEVITCGSSDYRADGRPAI